MTCPYCGAKLAFNAHGWCAGCEQFCGCSWNPSSRSDWCDHHWIENTPGGPLLAASEKFLEVLTRFGVLLTNVEPEFEAWKKAMASQRARTH